MEIAEGRECLGCSTFKLFKDKAFPPLKTGKYGYAAQCYSCRAKGNKLKYQTNKEYRLKSIAGATKAILKAYIRSRLITDTYLKEHSCVDCGNSDIRVLEFDHRNKEEKKFGIAMGRAYSKEVLEAEMLKCDVRCANCHRIRHRSELLSHKSGSGRPAIYT
jgi:hypothetical protein